MTTKKSEKKTDTPVSRISRKELARLISHRTGLPIQDVEKTIKVMQEIMIDEIFMYDTAVSFRNFGTFWRKETKRTNQNIFKLNKTKPKKTAKKRYAISFKTSESLREYLTKNVKKSHR